MPEESEERLHCSLAAYVTKQLVQNHVLVYHWVGACMLAFSGSPLDSVSICLVYIIKVNLQQGATSALTFCGFQRSIKHAKLYNVELTPVLQRINLKCWVSNESLYFQEDIETKITPVAPSIPKIFYFCLKVTYASP